MKSKIAFASAPYTNERAAENATAAVDAAEDAAEDLLPIASDDTADDLPLVKSCCSSSGLLSRQS